MQTLAFCCLLLLLVTPLSKACLTPHFAPHNTIENATWDRVVISTQQHSKATGAVCKQQVGKLGYCCSAPRTSITPKLSRYRNLVICTQLNQAGQASRVHSGMASTPQPCIFPHNAQPALLLHANTIIIFVFHSKQRSSSKTCLSPQFFTARRDMRKLDFLSNHQILFFYLKRVGLEKI
jgi:hypothetical protein